MGEVPARRSIPKKAKAVVIMMKQVKILLSLLLAGVMLLTAGCGKDAPSAISEESTSNTFAGDAAGGKVASAGDMAAVTDVVEEGMTPIDGSSLKDGNYSVTVDCSSSMFQVTFCELKVENGRMTATMHMGGKGYLYLFMGTGEEAAAAGEDEYIPYEETDGGEHTFTVPVKALDAGISCAAFSKKKEMWYDRTLLFRADSLPMDAFKDGVFGTVESLGMTDGDYTVDVKLSGGSGRAGVETPAALRVENGKAYATIVWSSPNYDYMKVSGERFDPVSTDGNAAFEIPVAAFDWEIPILADTTAMSTPHEIEYTLYFDSTTLEKAQ